MNENKKVMKGVEENTPRTSLNAFFEKVMKWLKKTPTWLKAFFGTVIFLILGLSALWVTKYELNMEQEALLVAIVLVPALLYLVLSGQVQEFGGGGLSLRFKTVANKELDEPIKINDINVGDLDCLSYDDFSNCKDKLEKKIQRSGNFKYHIITVPLEGPLKSGGERGEYHAKSLWECLNECATDPKFKFLAVSGKDKAIIAYAYGWKVKEILERSLCIQVDKEVREVREVLRVREVQEVLRVREVQEVREVLKVQEVRKSTFIDALNEGREQDLLHHDGLFRPTPRKDNTYLTVLEEMTERNMDALIITDDNGQLMGIVDREQVLSKLMLAFNKS